MISPSQLQVLATEAAPPRRAAPLVRLPRKRRRVRSDADVVIRFARPRDHGALRDLEALDGRTLPEGARLVAELDGVVVAAIDVGEGTVVADPFVCTANAVALLRVRARQLRKTGEQPCPPRLSLIERLAR